MGATPIAQLALKPTMATNPELTALLGVGAATDLSVRQALMSPHATLIKKMSTQAGNLQAVRLESAKQLKRYFKLKQFISKLKRRIRAYRKAHKSKSRGVASDLTDNPFKVDDILGDIKAHLSLLKDSLTAVYKGIKEVYQQLHVLDQMVAQQQLALESELTVIATSTQASIENDLSLLGLTIDKAHLLHPNAELSADFKHIDLDAFVKNLREQDPSIHHAHAKRLLHLVKFMHEHPKMTKDLGIDSLSDCTSEQLHDAVSRVRTHKLHAKMDKNWRNHDGQCDNCTQQHQAKIAEHTLKAEYLQGKMVKLSANADGLEQEINDCDKAYKNSTAPTPFSMRPQPGQGGKVDDEEEYKASRLT